MSYASEFLIEKGILKEYYGSGGIIEVPWGVTEIAPFAFVYCDIERLILPSGFVRLKKEGLRRVKSLGTIEITGSTVRFGKNLFLEDKLTPYIVAKKMQLGDVPQELKKYFCLGFAKEEESYSDSLKESYLKYIKHQRKDLFETALYGDELLRLMIREKILSREESTYLISNLSENGKTELSAEVLRYQSENFKPIDPIKEMLREANKDPYSKSEIKKLWEYENNGEEIKIKAYKGNDECFAVPPRVGKYPVTSIGNYCFNFSNRPKPEKGVRLKEFSEIYLPDTIKYLGKKAFEGCVGLTKIHLPESLGEISEGCFEDCRILSEIQFPENLKIIGSRAFLRCDGISSVIIPKNFEDIGSYAFSSCKNLVNLQIEEGCKKIQTEAFSDCINLESVVIKEGPQYLGYGAFGDCENLENVFLPKSITEIGRNAFYGCPNLTIHAPKDSYAEEYAKEHRIEFMESSCEEAGI